MHKDDVEYPRHHMAFGSWQFPKPGITFSLEQLRNMGFVNPLVGKYNDVGGEASNPQKHRHPIGVNQHLNPINFCLERQVGVVDVGQENLHRLLLHDALDHSDLHPPIVWSRRS